MADVFSNNERVTDTSGWYACWKLVRTLISAGWTVVRSSNGTSFGAADYWTVYASTGTSAWIVLQGPGNRQLCFWRSTSSTANGKIIYVPGGQTGFAFGGTYGAADPGTIPTNVGYVRGNASTFVSWFGGQANAIRWLTIAAKDVSDGSFWIVGTTPAAAVNSSYHTLVFTSLYAVDASDPDPYLFYCGAASPTGETTAAIYAHFNSVMGSDMESYWLGWSRGNTFRNYRPATPVSIMNSSGGGARDPYTPGNPFILESLAFGKTEAGYSEMKGYAKWLRVVSYADNRGWTYSEGVSPYRWVALGEVEYQNQIIVAFWDGVTPAMAFEY